MRASVGRMNDGNARRALDAAERRRLDRRLARLLTSHGLRRGPRPAELDAGPRWADFFAELGPVSAAFARYLSRRPDLRWLDVERAALARLDEDPLETLSLEAVPPDIASALSACRVDVASRPELADWSGAWFRAELSGRPIRLFIQRPGLAAEVEETLAVLERLAELTRGGDLEGHLDRRLVDDFFDHQVRPRLDVERRRRLFERLRAHGPDVLVIPELVPELSRAANTKIFAVEECSPAHGPARGRPRGLLSDGPLRSRGPAAARLLAACFIDLLSETGLLATDLQIARLEDGRAFLLDATCLEVATPPAPATSGKRILDFLRATASERPRDIVEIWRDEIDACGLDDGRLRSTLRQATPRRQFSSAGESAGETTAEYALAYWRAAADAGLVLGGPWRAASVAVEGLRRRFAEWDPEGDALARALVEQSWRESWQRLRSMATPRHVSLLAERYAAAFLELPSLIDRVLDLPAARRNTRRDSSRADERRSQERAASSSRLRAATPFLLALFSISLVSHRFGELRGVETAATVAFALLSLSLLKVILR